ncbi:MAG: aminopeptidase P family N-terminal domain-containing protein, partial [Oscillospiraceae bacterium]
SAGTLVVTDKESGLWTDGRYFVQAAKQIEDSEIKLYKMAVKGFPTVSEFLKLKLSKGDVLGLDGEVTALSLFEEYKNALAPCGAAIKSVPCVDECWADRPQIPASELYVHEIKFTGLTAAEKIDIVRKKLKEDNANSYVISGLTSIIWLLNVRAEDVKLNPYCVSFCMVTPTETLLFINNARVPETVKKHFKDNGVTLKNYEDILPFVKAYEKKETFLVDKANTSWDLFNAINENKNLKVVYGEDPITMLKAVKSEVEIKNIKNAHVKDGCAMVRFQIALEKKLNAKEKVTELDVVNMVLDERKKEKDFLFESFSTIAAYGANAAMMHYSPTPENNATVGDHGFLLLDNGGHYLDGTTDTTRTYAVGALTQKEKEYYTLVLKSHVDLAMVWFLEGITGGGIDIIARNPLWKKGLDYRCGTGHGVGYLGGIHEGPQSMRRANPVAFVPGMTVTDEPGIYEEGEVGIRIENGLLCVNKAENEYGKFLGFETITYVPYDLTPIVTDMLDREE